MDEKHENIETQLPNPPAGDDGIRILRSGISVDDIADINRPAPPPPLSLVPDTNGYLPEDDLPIPQKRTRKRKAPTVIPLVLEQPPVNPALIPQPPPRPVFQKVFGGEPGRRSKLLVIHQFYKSSFRPYLEELGFNFRIDYLHRLAKEDLDIMTEELKYAIAIKERSSGPVEDGFFGAVKLGERTLGLSGLSASLKADPRFRELVEEMMLEYATFTVFPVEQRFLYALLEKMLMIWMANKAIQSMGEAQAGRAERLFEELLGGTNTDHFFTRAPNDNPPPIPDLPTEPPHDTV
jgi:hypothetical protein